jgi:hypothetical protein
MCLPKPKVDPNVAELTRQQQADADAAARDVQLDISEQKQEDKDLAITDIAARKRYSMLNSSQASPSNLGQRFG